MATEEFLRKGIDCIEYKDDKRVNIASYVQMALRTAATRSYLQGEAKGRDELGIDTVLVAQYGACSNTCLPWQGRVYIDNVWGSWNGEREGDRGKSRDGNWYVLLSVAIKNGLFHPNCRHISTQRRAPMMHSSLFLCSFCRKILTTFCAQAAMRMTHG